MILRWNDIMLFLTRPKAFLLGKEKLMEIEFAPSEHQKILEIMVGKILPNARITFTGDLFVEDRLLDNSEKDLLSQAFEDYIAYRGNPKLLGENLLEKTWFTGATLEITTYCNFRCPHCLLPIERRTGKNSCPQKQ